MALKEEEKTWWHLIKEWLGTQIIWTLGNFGLILMELLFTGFIIKITWVFFISGEYGCASTCWISMIKQKWGYMGEEDLKDVRKTLNEVDGISTTTVSKRESRQELLDEVKATDKDISIELNERLETLEKEKAELEAVENI